MGSLQSSTSSTSSAPTGGANRSSLDRDVDGDRRAVTLAFREFLIEDGRRAHPRTIELFGGKVPDFIIHAPNGYEFYTEGGRSTMVGLVGNDQQPTTRLKRFFFSLEAKDVFLVGKKARVPFETVTGTGAPWDRGYFEFQRDAGESYSPVRIVMLMTEGSAKKDAKGNVAQTSLPLRRAGRRREA